MIEYRSTSDGITPDMLRGCFVGWPNPPSPETYLRIPRHSDAVELAVDAEAHRVVRFITVINDHVSGA